MLTNETIEPTLSVGDIFTVDGNPAQYVVTDIFGDPGYIDYVRYKKLTPEQATFLAGDWAELTEQEFNDLYNYCIGQGLCEKTGEPSVYGNFVLTNQSVCDIKNIKIKTDG